MRKIVFEAILVLVIAIIAALVFNHLSGHGIQILKKYVRVEPVEEKYNVETIDIEIFLFYLNRGGTIVLDARNEEDFKAGHIPGASSFSVGKFDALFREKGELLKLGKTILIYCSGPDCMDSGNLAVLLHEKGIQNILVFKGGMEEWIGSGREIRSDHN